MMKMVLYIYGKCSTCKDAVSFLEKTHKGSVLIKEITQTPPSVEELQKMLQYKNGNLKALFNTSGQMYKDLKLNEKLNDMPLDEALKLLSQNGMLVKRPFLLGNNFGLTGFKESEWSQMAECQNRHPWIGRIQSSRILMTCKFNEIF